MTDEQYDLMRVEMAKSVLQALLSNPAVTTRSVADYQVGVGITCSSYYKTDLVNVALTISESMMKRIRLD